MTKDEEIKEFLFSNNADFRRLADEHRSYDDKLRELNNRPHASGGDQLEEVSIKKKKLNLKDQMTRMIQEYRQDQLSHQQP
jgi:uncharacterized protein YdcH (DUF465 family)